MKIKINNLSVFVTGNKNNNPIIFVHGFPFDHRMWDDQVKEFSKNNYCVTYDIRGLGESPAGDGQFTIESFVDDLETVVDELELLKPVLCGLSMGGYISLRAVERMEEKFCALILCDTKSLADDNEGKIKRAVAIKSVNEYGVSQFVEQFVSICFSYNFMVEHKEEYEKVLTRSEGCGAEGIKGCLLAMAGRTDTTSYLQKINLPTLIICGNEDIITPSSVMKPMAQQIKNSEFHVVNEAGHMTPVEAANIVNEKIRSFLAKYLKR
jgi:pimeloyl-ACP methyl ester carboxylesterase